MSFHSIRIAAGLSRACSTLALGIGVAACGGGGQETFAGASTSTSTAQRTDVAAAAVSWVRVQGCVVDRFHVPTTGTPVRALGADGRLLGNASSDGQGRFTLKVQPQHLVTLAIDRPEGDAQSTALGSQDVTTTACLLDDRA
jgi:hypothetical protein